MGAKGFSFCAVCRRNHEQGRGHRYTAGHRNALQSVLGKIRMKIEGLRGFLGNPRDQAPSHRFWCLFCEEDVADNQGSSSIACSNAIHHLASAAHVSNVKRFWCENGADANTRHDFFFSRKEIADWEAVCGDGALADSSSVATTQGAMENNIHHERFLAAKSSQSPSVCVEPLQKISKDQTLQVNGATAHRHTVAAFGGNLATVTPRPLVSSKGNVHSGAPPPWLSDLPTHGSDDGCPKGISKRKRREMERLDKRVGAAWANRRKAQLERDAAPRREEAANDWLPSFGRVWQNGSRRDSRKEFEMEKKKLREETTNSTPPAVQPYVGKRKHLQMEAGGGKHD
ncbi:hypothetical protein SELMODRAFT_431817 [Selaginella moellendorffii]|uniref:TITAN-like protein n=1 Tax=Selaginella moellendorffii TaxID=88036 RepID=D8TDX0_SELML|nr:TITAN-like protein [Selaginella moellendorffii]EFJ05157.1 hypothetical protein SELMODRAFT_431817 [Selaginella moellendorffii]|eukprot:XP_002993791.1 TITAN-like protein [Selaginella moellendorffii]